MKRRTKSIEQIKEEHRNTYQPLFDYMSREHNVTLLESDMSEIIHIVRTNNLPIDTLTAEIMVLRERVEELEECLREVTAQLELKQGFESSLSLEAKSINLSRDGRNYQKRKGI